uniref:Uncharacterized protein MANES_14G001800 n=1 Tax=Rhizophora mucronata TaxID=61149 RepID=A0A2P2KCF9_RHIMU
MSWNPHMDVHHTNNNYPYPYNSAGSFVEYFRGLTYEHLNFIFDGGLHVQESMYPSVNADFYKFGISQSGITSYDDHTHAYEVNDHGPPLDEYRRPLEGCSAMNNEETAVENTEWESSESTITQENAVECMRMHLNAHDYQATWQDNIDPDNMTYEELLELGDAVGTQSRGLSQELISLLPISKHKCSFFSRRKSGSERCVICQMEYKRGDPRITLPCKHVYHVACGTQWLSINKACPICYKEVFGDGSKS